MKNVNYLLVYIVLMLSPVCSWAEDEIMDGRYFPDGMTWKTMAIETYMMSEIVRVDKSTYILQGDTLIGERIYHKLVNEKGKLIATITEEGKKIYLRCNETDMLLYDFGVEVGDTIVQDFSTAGISWCDAPCKLCVVRIDTVTLLNGKQAKRICYDHRGTTDLEFVGSEYGILAPIYMPQIPLDIDWHFYSCCSLNGDILFEHNQGDCERIDMMDAIDETLADKSATKILRDGHILIIRDNRTYTLTGQPVE